MFSSQCSPNEKQCFVLLVVHGHLLVFGGVNACLSVLSQSMKLHSVAIHCVRLRNHLREFVKTHVILAPLREFSRSRAASKIPFPGAQPGRPGKAGEPDFFNFRCKNRYSRSRMI